MEIQVHTTVAIRKKALALAAKFYANELNLQKSKYTLHIVLKSGLKKDGMVGLAAKVNDDAICVALHNKLTTEQFLLVLAHEMVHVKQIARGQYKHVKTKRGNLRQFWMGKQVNRAYINRPWEIEAYSREAGLLAKLLTHMSKNKKRKG